MQKSLSLPNSYIEDHIKSSPSIQSISSLKLVPSLTLSPWIGLSLYSLITQLLLSSLPAVEDLH